MKEIKVIDLLNKMNNENYRPLQVKWRSKTYYYKAEYGHYYNNENGRFGLFAGYTIEGILNDTVEIIEEDNKKINKLDYCEEHTFSVRQTGMTKEDRRLLDSNFKELGNKINEIIDKINNMEE